MMFKEENMREDYFKMPFEMRDMLMFCERYYHDQDVDFVITSLFRTEAEQREVSKQLGRPYKPSVHMFYRGADIRTRYLPEEKITELETLINYIYPYDCERPNLKSAIIEKDHIHLQVKG